MSKFYKSEFYSKPIEIADIEGEKLIIITDNQNRESIYSWYDVIEQNTQSFYINKCLFGGFVKRIPENVLIIGFGGGAFAKYLEDHIQNINITGIEIDKAMAQIASKEFYVRTKDIYLDDANIALDKIIDDKKCYDLVLIDVYGPDGEIPEYFGEDIFIKKLSKVLKINGTISINYSNYDIDENDRLKKYEKIHSNFLKCFSKNYSFLIEGKKDNGNKVGIYNLDKQYSKSDFELNYLENVKLGKIKYDKKLYSDFKIL